MTVFVIRARNAIACEDLRQEADGKMFAIGILNPLIGRDKPRDDGTFPPIKLHFILSLDVPEKGEHEMRFRLRPLTGKGGSSTAKLRVQFIEAAKNIPFPLGPMRVRLGKDATGFVLEQAAGEHRWTRVASWRLEDVGESKG